MRFYTDYSWLNSGGIGTFLKEISCRIELFDLGVKGDKTSILSCLRISVSSLKVKCGVLFIASYIPPLFSRVPYVFTIHDLNHLERCENSSFLKRLFYNTIIKNGCIRSAKIITVSEFSKNQIVNWCKVNPTKVINVGNGVSKIFNKDIVCHSPGYDYFLCVSNRKGHKNELRLIEAFSESSINYGIKLLLTGNPSPELIKFIKDLDVEDRIVFSGFVPDDKLPSYYRGSLGLLFPSFYEGFGLPVVEAMACGVPVLTSNTTSLPEVAGDAALLVNPESLDEIRSGIERLYFDQVLRSELIAKGFERAKSFSWDDVAQRVQAVLDEVAQSVK